MISTRSRSKERNSPQHESPYKTRSKRKSQDQKNDLRQFQESADIIAHEEKFTIRRSFSYLVSLSNKTGWLRIDKLWTFDDTLKIEATCFTKPSMNKNKKDAFGQDQLIGHRAKLLLNADRFTRMLVRNKPEVNNNKNIPKHEVTSNFKPGNTLQKEELSPRQPASQQQSGSVTLSTKRIIQRSRDTTVYYQLKNPVTNIVENISANAVVHSLGFARFNAGTKKKNPENHGGHMMKHKLVREAMTLDYKDYCLHRKLKKLLESGGVVLKEEAEKLWVVTDHPICIFYTHAHDSQQKAETWISRMDDIDDVMYEEFSKHSKVDDEQIGKLTAKYRRQTI